MTGGLAAAEGVEGESALDGNEDDKCGSEIGDEDEAEGDGFYADELDEDG